MTLPPEPTRVIGESAAMQTIFQTIRKFSETDANLLLLGENGTGKDLIARYVYEQSPRKNEIYVPIDLGSIPDTLFESELFGYERVHLPTPARISRDVWKWLQAERCS